MTLWFHPLCAAYKRPESMLQTLAETTADVAGRDALERAARGSVAFRRLPRIDGAERAPGAQARCRSCRERIERGTWRIRLVFFEESRFTPGGFVHVACHPAYFEGHDVLGAVLHFSPDLSDEDRSDLTQACAAPPTSGTRPCAP